MARFLLRDGKTIGAEVSPESLETYRYRDHRGEAVYALCSARAERQLLRQIPSQLLPLYLRMDLAMARAVSRS